MGEQFFVNSTSFLNTTSTLFANAGGCADAIYSGEGAGPGGVININASPVSVSRNIAAQESESTCSDFVTGGRGGNLSILARRHREETTLSSPGRCCRCAAEWVRRVRETSCGAGGNAMFRFGTISSDGTVNALGRSVNAQNGTIITQYCSGGLSGTGAWWGNVVDQVVC